MTFADGRQDWRDPAYLDFLRQAREQLSGFTEWLVKGCGVSDGYADTVTAIVCRATWEYDDPTDKLSDPMLNRPSYSKLKSAFKRYYTWKMIRKGATDSEKQQARHALNFITKTIPPGDIVPQKRKRLVEPIPQDLFRKALRRLPAWTKKNGPRWPWAHAAVGIKLKLAPSMNGELVYLQRHDLVRALVDGPEWGTVQLWNKKKKKATDKIVPVSHIEEEAKMLINWPWEWEILADIVSPSAAKGRRTATAASAIGKVTFKFLEEAIDYHPEASEGKLALKYATWVWLFKKLKGDWLSLSRITGAKEHTLRSLPALLAVIS